VRWSAPAVGLLALLAPAGPRQPAVSGNDVWIFATGGRRLLPDRAAERHALAPEAFYQAPVLRSSPERRPNLILVILESTGARAVATGSAVSATPALARLAASGLTVETAYATVTHTSKALVGILCGLPPRSGMDIVESLEGNLPVPCLPRLLGELGYKTVFLQSASGYFENRPGLVRNLGFAEGAYRETLERPGFERLGYFGLDDRAMLEPALGWIAAVGEAPYFMTLLTSAPHHPYQTPGTALRQALEEPRAAYRRAIAEQDRLLGDLVGALEASGALERSVLVVLGDHGEAFGEHQRQQHDAVPYEEVVRVPWVLHGPALLGPPRTIPGLRHQVDLLPTVLALLGVEWEGTLPGRDLLSTAGHDLVVASCWWANTCLAGRSGDLKAIYHFGRRPVETFDLARDPGERGLPDAAPPAEGSHELEERLLGYRLTIDRFWARVPVHEGPETWWAEDLRGVAEGTAPAATAPGRSR
jgi:phosphoglycerol transferase MdoB-like AlkP superfamily enzyme